MSVFVTGGTGLIGSHVASRLREQGRRVVCLQRPTSDTSFLRSIGCEIVSGDVRDEPDRIAGLMEGCQGLVHAAALVYADAPWPRIRAINVEGTEKVLKAGVIAGVSRAVHLSSVAVYGEVRGAVDEETPTDRPLRPTDLYARSKREAEDAVLAVSREGSLAVRVLRVAAVYGERDRIFAPALAAFVRWPVTPLVGPGTNTVPVVYAGNVAAGVTAALELEGEASTVFNLGGDHPMTQRELLAGIARGMGETPRFVPLPEPIVRWGARLADALGMSPPGAPDLSFSRVAYLALADNPFETRRAHRILGWDPPHPPEEALGRTGAWLRTLRTKDVA